MDYNIVVYYFESKAIFFHTKKKNNYNFKIKKNDVKDKFK